MSKPEKNAAYILRFDEIRAADLPRVGGKNASLGEMYSTMSGAGVPVPPGFAITVEAYRAFLAANGLEEKIRTLLAEMRNARVPVPETGLNIRRLIENGRWPEDVAQAIRKAYADLCGSNGGQIGRAHV